MELRNPHEGKDITARYKKLKGDRGIWENFWEEIAFHCIPDWQGINTLYTPGQQKNTHLYDNTGVQSNELLASHLHGMLTNPATIWFGLTTGDRALDRNPEVASWLEESAHRMHRVMNESNFQTEVHSYYITLTSLCTSALLIEQDEVDVVRFTALHIKDYCIEENHMGVVDRMYRCVKMKGHEIIDMFEKDGMITDEIKRKLMESKEGQMKEWEVIHAIYPRVPVEKITTAEMPYYSQYVLMEGNHTLRAKKFQEFPGVVARWTKQAGEVYGRGPGTNALPELKTLNKMTEVVLKTAAKIMDPPLMLPDHGFMMPLKTRPGGLNFYRAGSAERIEKLPTADRNIDFGYQEMGDRRARVRQAFFADQLQLVQSPEMTATEVLQRTEEQMRLLGPMLGRQQIEFLRPLVNRVFAIMDRRGLFDEPPQALVEAANEGAFVNLGVQYQSLIAKAQKASEGQTLDRFLGSVLNLAQAEPKMLDNIDFDEVVRKYGEILGTTQDIFRSPDEVSEMREAQAQASQEQADMMRAQSQAEVANKVAPLVQGG